MSRWRFKSKDIMKYGKNLIIEYNSKHAQEMQEMGSNLYILLYTHALSKNA